MKGVRAFLNNMFSDRGVFSVPHTDAHSLMYGLSTFTADVPVPERAKRTKLNNLISFTDYKLRRA